MTQDSTNAAINTAVSIAAASVTLTQIQPFISFVAGLVAILSGLLASVHYIKQITKPKNE